MAIARKTTTGKGRPGSGLEAAVKGLRRDAEALVARNRTELKKRLEALRKDLKARADQALRDVERRVLKQLHAASEERVRKLEKRVAVIEKRVAVLEKTAGQSPRAATAAAGQAA